MPNERDSTSPQPRPHEVNDVQVRNDSPGRRTLTARLAGTPFGRQAIETTQNLLQRLYQGLPSTKPSEQAQQPATAAPTNAPTNAPVVDTGQNQQNPSPSGWAVDQQGGARADRTSEYRTLADQSKQGQNTLPPDAQNYVYLMVPGLFTEHYPGYMKENNAKLDELGLQHETVQIDTDASVETNAQVIREAIMRIAEKEGKQVVLVGHSKGGVDATAAIAMYPELEEHVRAVVAMQSPYGGTPIASDIAANSTLLGWVSRAIKGLFKGDTRALTDLTYNARQDFVEKHPYAADRVPTVSFATTGGPAFSPTAPSAYYMNRQYGLESDGLVPSQDAIVPGSDLVTQDNLDHSGPVMAPFGSGKADAPADITQALITLALRRAQEMEDAEYGPPAPP